MKQEDKKRFFGCYTGQEVVRMPFKTELTVPLKALYYMDSEWEVANKSYLELISLDQITDEHAIQIQKIIKYAWDLEGIKRWARLNDVASFGSIGVKEVINVFDFLRKNGYLVPFDKYSCEELQELDWCKTK